MTAKNLAIVFGPNLVWSKSQAASLDAMAQINSFTLLMLENVSYLFETSWFPEHTCIPVRGVQLSHNEASIHSLVAFSWKTCQSFSSIKFADSLYKYWIVLKGTDACGPYLKEAVCQELCCTNSTTSENHRVLLSHLIKGRERGGGP